MNRVLHIAETDPDLQDAYRILCAARGYHVETSDSAVDCLQRIQEFTPDALIVDVDIRWGGGEGLAACLRQWEASTAAALPPIFVTGNEDPEEISRRTGVLPEHCFQKPFRIGSLLDAINSVLCDTWSAGRVGA